MKSGNVSTLLDREKENERTGWNGGGRKRMEEEA
jgi:hypothetical protein